MSIFKKIIDKEIPAKIVYEDEICLAFHDISPAAPTHVLLIPKKEIRSMAEVKPEDQEILGHMMVQIPRIAKELGIADGGFRTVINTNDMGGQEVYHLHLHIIGGREMQWPPG